MGSNLSSNFALSLVVKKILSILSDATLVFLAVVIAKTNGESHLSSSPLTVLVWSIALTPLMIFFQDRFLGQSFGHWLLGLRRVQKSTGKRPQRIFDWLFESETVETPNDSLPLPVQALSTVAMMVLTGGVLFYAAAQDPVLRRLKERTIPIFAPAEDASDWRVTPWYYTSGAWPTRFAGSSVLYSLPYEKGPPHRFVGRFQSYWGKTGIRVMIVGPLTLRSVGTREELKDCFTRMFGCASVRKEMYSRPLAPFTQTARFQKLQWFSVDNPLLDPEERPEGLYVVGKARNGETLEGYFLVNTRMTVQGFLLYRYDTEDGVKASETLAQAIGSFRMTTDLKASTAWINQSLSKTDLRKGGNERLLEGQGLLLSKISVDPLAFDPFYYLATTAYVLFQDAAAKKQLEEASSAKSMILSAYRYATDVKKDDPRMKELDLFKAKVENF